MYLFKSLRIALGLSVLIQLTSACGGESSVVDSTALAQWSASAFSGKTWISTGNLPLKMNFSERAAVRKEIAGKNAVVIAPDAVAEFKDGAFGQFGRQFTFDMNIYIGAMTENIHVLDWRQSIRVILLKDKNGVVPCLTLKLWKDAVPGKMESLKGPVMVPGWHRLTILGKADDKAELYIDGRKTGSMDLTGWRIASSPFMAVNGVAEHDVKLRKSGELTINSLALYPHAITPEELDIADQQRIRKEQEQGWKIIGMTDYTSGIQPGKVNYAAQAVMFTNGTYANPPWSAEAVVQTRMPIPAQGFVNTDPQKGWICPSFGTEPEKPYVLMDFPFDSPIEFDTLGMIVSRRDSSQFRSPFIIERRLGDKWETIYKPSTQAEASNPLIRFATPVKANALRLTFQHPSPNGYWAIERFWVFGDKSAKKSFQGGTLEVVSDEPKIENEIVLSPERRHKFMVVYQPAQNNLSLSATLKLFLTDYTRNEVKDGRIELPINISAKGEFEYTLPVLPAGPYFLCGELWHNNALLLRSRQLFGITGIQPVPVTLQNMRNNPLREFELAGAVGQFDGIAQQKNTDVVDAFKSINANTIQVEMFWSDLEPLPGVYNFNNADKIIEYIFSKGMYIGFTMYIADDQTPAWMRQDKYVMRDQYGNPATGRNPWKLKFYSPPSVNSPLFKEHFRKLWYLIAQRYMPTGRVVRLDPRPPLLEAFFFDNYTNRILNNDRTDYEWDYSEWARQDFIVFLRDYRNLSLAEINKRYHTDWKSYQDIQLPQPLPLAERHKDERPLWIDFQYFKNYYTIQEYYLNVAEEIDRASTTVPLTIANAPIDDSKMGNKLKKYVDDYRTVSGRFSIEHGNLFIGYHDFMNRPSRLCFEWGEPAPPYYHFNAGLFYILPFLNHSSLRWVAKPCIGLEQFNDTRYWKSWVGLGKIAPKLKSIAGYEMSEKPQIAVLGGFDSTHDMFDGARPIRHRRKINEWDRWIVNCWGGLGGVLSAAIFYNGLPPYSYPRPADKVAEVKLAIDGGNPECPAEQQKNTLEYVKNGGKLLMWSNSFRFAGERPSDMIQKAIGFKIDCGKADETQRELVLNLDGTSPFKGKIYRSYPVTIANGKVIGTVNGQPAAWLIPYGKGEIMLINGLPYMEKADGWTPFIDGVCRWSGVIPPIKVEMQTEFMLPNLLTYTMTNSRDGSYIIPVFNCSPKILNGKITYKGLLNQKLKYRVEVFHSTDKESRITSERRMGNDMVLEVCVAPLDMLLVKVLPER